MVPPPREVGSLTAYSFLDEEIAGLAGAGVQPFVLTGASDRTFPDECIHLLPLPEGAAPGERMRTLSFLVRNVSALSRETLREFRKAYHAVRIERWAAANVRQHGIEVIHSHFGLPGFGGLLAARAAGIPLIATFRGMDLLLAPELDYGLRRDPFYDQAVGKLIRRATLTTYASDFMRLRGLRLGAREGTARTVRKGVDLDRFSPAADRDSLRAELGFRGPVVLTVAGLIRRKGIDTIINGLAPLRETHDFTLVVCGDGPEKDALAALSREVGLGDRVRFVGRIHREAIPGYFAAADIFVLASRLEAAGNVLLEAMAAGRPVVCTDSGGPPEYVQDGRTGFVVPPDDPEQMTAAFTKLLNDPALREKLGRQGRAAVEEKHDYRRMIEDFRALYERVAGTDRGRRQLRSANGRETAASRGAR